MSQNDPPNTDTARTPEQGKDASANHRRNSIFEVVGDSNNHEIVHRGRHRPNQTYDRDRHSPQNNPQHHPRTSSPLAVSQADILVDSRITAFPDKGDDEEPSALSSTIRTSDDSPSASDVDLTTDEKHQPNTEPGNAKGEQQEAATATGSFSYGLDDGSSLPPVSVEEVENLTAMTQADGLLEAEQYETLPQAAGRRVRDDVSRGARQSEEAAQYLGKARSLFMLTQESLEMDGEPSALPREIRRAIKETPLARAEVTRAYLHKYRHEIMVVKSINQDLQNQKSQQEREVRELKDTLDQICQKFGETVMEKEILEEKLRLGVQLPGHAVTRDRSDNSAASGIVDRADEREPLSDDGMEYSSELLDPQRRSREEINPRDETPSPSIKTDSLPQDSDTGEHSLSGAHGEYDDQLQVQVRSPDIPIDDTIEHAGQVEETNIAASHNEDNIEPVHEQANEHHPSDEAIQNTITYLNASDTSNSPEASPAQPSFAPRLQLVGPPHRRIAASMPQRWQLREQTLRNSQTYRQDLDAFRRQGRAERLAQTDYEDLQRRVYEMQHRGRSGPRYIPRQERREQLEAIIKCSEVYCS